MTSNNFQRLRNLYRNRHCFDPDNMCSVNDYCLKCFAYLLQENSNVSGISRWSISMEGEMKIVKSVNVSKKMINSNTNEITFQVTLERSDDPEHLTADDYPQSVSSSISSSHSISQEGSSSPSGQDLSPNISTEHQQDPNLFENQNQNNDFCLECNKKLANSSSLKRHVIRFHTEQEVPRVFCALCEKTFHCKRAKELLTKHYNQDHHNVLYINLDFNCRICKRGYGNIMLLQSHFVQNHSKKPFQCPQCRKEFSTKDKKTRHFKSHSTQQCNDLDWAITF